MHGAGDVRLEPLSALEPRPEEAVVGVAYGGICGSDLHYWRHGAAGDSILRAPMILGHEVAGVILRGASDGSGPSAGERVTIHPAIPGTTPGERWPSERPNISSGGSYLGSAARFPHTDGAFASTIAVPARMLRALPASIPLEQAALIEPASVAWHAVARGGEVSGTRILILGCGPIGVLIAAAAKAAGAAEIWMADIDPATRELALKVGADQWLDARDPAVATIDPDVVFEASGSRAAIETAILTVARGGRIVLVGLVPSGAHAVPLSPIISREIDVVGAFRFADEIDSVIEALASGLLDVEPIISHIVDVDDFARGLELAGGGGKVLIRFADPSAAGAEAGT